MSGHSKWATTKRQKSVVDAKRGKTFTKLANAIVMAARRGGGDPSSNVTLRLAMDKAREANMPRENIERAIKRGTGELAGETLEEFTYEAVGPGGSAFIIEGVTDKKTRTVADIRQLLQHLGAKMAAVGSQLWQFKRLGELRLSVAPEQTEQAQLDAIESGAEDVLTDAVEDSGEAGGELIVLVQPAELAKVREQLINKKYTVDEPVVAYRATTRVELSETDKAKAREIQNALDEHDDVQQVAVNF